MKHLRLTSAILILAFAGSPVLAQDDYYDSYFESLETLRAAGLDLTQQAIATYRAGDKPGACQLLRRAGGKFLVGRIDAENTLEEMRDNGTGDEIAAMKKALEIMKAGEADIAFRSASCPDT